MFASSTIVKITIEGKGGHGSTPHLIKDPISAGAAIINNLHLIKSRFIENSANFVFTITNFESGHTYNVFPDSAFM